MTNCNKVRCVWRTRAQLHCCSCFSQTTFQLRASAGFPSLTLALAQAVPYYCWTVGEDWKERHDSDGHDISAEECVDGVRDRDVSGFSETESSGVEDDKRDALFATAFHSSVRPR